MSAIADSYTEHIRCAFIDPIRSVLAIDDEYPTFDHILSLEGTELKGLARDKNWDRLQSLVSYCRSRDQELLIDVHNGSAEDLKHSIPLRSLRQCDWVVLDYQLNGDGGDGTRSCEILSSLAASNNFNLVTVYTKKSIDEVFKEVVLAFSDPLSTDHLPTLDSMEFESAVDDWSDGDPDIEDKLVDAISGDVYLRLLERGYWGAKQKPSCKDLLGDFLALYRNRPSNFPVDKVDLIGWAARKFEEKHSISSSPPRVSCKAKAKLDDSRKWMLVGNLFVSFIGKDVDAENLLEETLKCLAAWRPSPNRLALSRLRAELDASGILADNEVMNDRELQAYWLSKLLSVEDWERREQVGGLVDRQTELLLERLRQKVVQFTGEVLSSLEGADVRERVAEFFPDVEKPEEGVVSHNVMVSTRPVGGSNLVPGHILKIDDPDGSIDLWVCLSPACDMVPRRGTGRDLKLRLNGWLPFTAVKLFKLGKKKDALSKASQGHVVFIRNDEALEHYSIYKSGNLSSSPVWEEFFAKDEGVLDGESLSITLAQIQSVVTHGETCEEHAAELAAEVAFQEKTGASIFSAFKVSTSSIVAQLRSEYAVNLTQKLSSHMSRVGLDYSKE